MDIRKKGFINKFIIIVDKTLKTFLKKNHGTLKSYNFTSG